MTKPRVLILNGTCLDVVEEHREWLDSFGCEIVTDPAFRTMTEADVPSILADADALILPAPIRTLPREAEMRTFTRIQTLSIAASGYDWLDVSAATECGIAVTFAPVPEGAEVVADMTWGLMLAAARQIPHHHALIRAGDHRRGMGVSLWRKTLGIVGLGNIGRAVARRAAGFEMKVLATEPQPNMDFVKAQGIELVSLEELLRRSDFVSLHVRLDKSTEGMIGARELLLMKRTAFLINAARDKLVDERALTEAILAGRLAGAGLDDPPADTASPLFRHPSVVFTTHLGNRAIEGVVAVFRCAVENAVTVLRGERPKLLVNPAVYEKPASGRRFALRTS